MPLRDEAEEKLIQSTEVSLALTGKTPGEIIHELQVHQIELEIQNEELKKAHQDLEDSRDRYIDLYDFAPVGYFSLTKETIISEVNLTGANMLGMVRYKLLNTRFRTYISLGNQPLWDSFIFTILNHNEQQTGEFELIRKDGAGFSARIEGIRVEKIDGSIQVRIAMSDVTQCKRVEKDLRESEKRYRMLIETLNEGVWVIDKDSITTFVNPRMAEILGYTAQEMIGKSLFSFMDEQGQRICTQNLERRRQGIKEHHDFEFLKQDGTMIYASLEATPIIDEDGVYRGAIAGVADITDRTYAEKALHESNQKLRLLTNLTRHDILNQICAVKLLQDMALDTSDPVKLQEYLSRTLETANLIEATIGFTREYENFGVVSSGWQRIFPIIESAKTEISPGSITIHNQIPESLEIYADPIIRKVFTTLMENAIRHGKNIQNIRFLSSEFEDTLLLICEDDGIGITDEEKDRIFDHGY
ncbi:MAG: hypothetical protein CVV33_10705, partial [Methanomicrobiales archaeon HGW-Methanomicrobiales-4]